MDEPARPLTRNVPEPPPADLEGKDNRMHLDPQSALGPPRKNSDGIHGDQESPPALGAENPPGTPSPGGQEGHSGPIGRELAGPRGEVGCTMCAMGMIGR